MRLYKKYLLLNKDNKMAYKKKIIYNHPNPILIIFLWLSFVYCESAMQIIIVREGVDT